MKAADVSDSLYEIPARRGFYIAYKGKTLLSRIDPVAQGERIAEETPLKEKTLYFCPSPLYGYGLHLFLQKLEKSYAKNSAILCVEADEKLFEISKKALGGLLESAKEHSGSEELIPLALVNNSDPESLCSFVRETWGERVFRRVELFRPGGGWQLFPELYDEMAFTLRREIALEWGNAMTLIRLGRLYTRNLIRNLAKYAMSRNIKDLNYGSSPILVLGAGPSIDPILDELAQLSGGKIPGPGKRPYKIICVDTSLTALNDRGIIPDLTVILESQHWNLRDFSGVKDKVIDAAIDLSALPASTRVLGGKSLFFTTQWTHLLLFKRLEEAGLLPGTFSPLGSVGLSAVSLALYLGTGPVVLGGIDFSYTLDASHARSTPVHSELLRRQNRFRSLINPAALNEKGFSALSKCGLTVKSDPVMRNYRDLFIQEFSANTRLLDIKSSGLPLGVNTLPIAEAHAVLNKSDGSPEGAASSDHLKVVRRASPPGNAAPQNCLPQNNEGKTIAFIRREAGYLESLKGILCGEINTGTEKLEELLDTLDYLWAHFPDCAGAGGRRPKSTDIGFLKRVRTEIDPFLKLWKKTLAELE